MNVDPPVDRDDPRWWMSALADGEAGPEECSRGLGAWADAGSVARERWHAYQLIGDVLRSGDLAHAAELDRDFLARLAARLDAEPAPAAPVVDLAVRRRSRWMLPAGLAAGVLALGTALLVLHDPNPGPAGASRLLAAATPPAANPGAASAAAVEVTLAGARVLRDAQLDRYLRAHREYGAAQPVSLPGGSGRSLETVSFER